MNRNYVVAMFCALAFVSGSLLVSEKVIGGDGTVVSGSPHKMNLSVAFRMKKREDSQMIIEEPGAEQLQMHGDLLMKDDKGVRRALGYYTDLAFLKHVISGITR